jgi:hypothetical protein
MIMRRRSEVVRVGGKFGFVVILKCELLAGKFFARTCVAGVNFGETG